MNTVSVYLICSRFGDVKGFLSDGTLNPVYRDRLENPKSHGQKRNDDHSRLPLLEHLQCKPNLTTWAQEGVNEAVKNTARSLKEKQFTNIFFDPDNKGMAVKELKLSVELQIRLARQANPYFIICEQHATNARNEDPRYSFWKTRRWQIKG